MVIMTKQCSKCGNILPLDKEHFYKKDKGKHWHSACKKCMNAKATERARGKNITTPIQTDSVDHGNILPQQHGKNITILPQDIIDDMEEAYFHDEEQTRTYVKAIHKKIVNTKKDAAE